MMMRICTGQAEPAARCEDHDAGETTGDMECVGSAIAAIRAVRAMWKQNSNSKAVNGTERSWA
jgi:hypothetical protein